MYTKTSWVARVGTALNRFLKTNETSTEVELTNDPTGVTTAGTPFTVANMNKIEQGIYDAHVTADANASNLLANVNQGVKTTDSPTFASVVTTNGPNKPIDSDDNVIPAIGVGGFTFFHHPTEQTCTMPSGGFFMVIGETKDGVVKIERVAGGVGSQAYHAACIFRLS